MFTNKIPSNRFYSFLAWCRVNDKLYCYIQGNRVCSPGPPRPTCMQASFLSTTNKKLIVDSQLCVCAHVYIAAPFIERKDI